MISIRNYLHANKTIVDRTTAHETTEDTLFQLAQILIAGIERCSVQGPPGELTTVRESTRQVLAAVESHAPRDEVLSRAERAMETMRQHNQRVVEFLQRPVVELQAKVNLLTDAITKVSGGSSGNIRRLRQIKSQVLSSANVRELRSYKLRVSECLDSILAEAERQRAVSDRLAGQINRSNMRNAPDSGIQTAAVDPATGLPVRSQAEETIAKACEGEAAAFVVVMVVNQMENLNRTFGREFGDVILRRFAVLLREQIPAIDPLFRWSGPTVVALIRRRTMLEVRGVVEPVLLERISVKAVASDVQVPISSRWTVLPLMVSPRLLFHKIDSFAQFD